MKAVLDVYHSDRGKVTFKLSLEPFENRFPIGRNLKSVQRLRDDLKSLTETMPHASTTLVEVPDVTEMEIRHHTPKDPEITHLSNHK